MSEYVLLCKRISREMDDPENPRPLSALISDLRYDRIYSKLMVDIKRHKGRGDVSFRAIDGAQASPLKLGMRLISRWLQPHIDQRPHILKDVSDLVSFLKSTKFDHDVCFLKTDVKDFFMSGGHEELTV